MGKAQALTNLDRYLSDFHSFERDATTNWPEWVRHLRQEAMSRFADLKFPTARRGNEKWKYTSVVPIANTVFEYPFGTNPAELTDEDVRRHAPRNTDWVNLVFVNGQFCRPLSTTLPHTDGIEVTNLADVVLTDGKLAERYLAREASYNEDAFTALNTSFLRDGAYVNVASDRSFNSPVHLLFLTSERAHPSVSHPRTLVVAGPRSKLTLVESYVALSDSVYFSNAVTEIVVGEGAEVEHYRLLVESPEAFHIGNTQVRQGPDSSFSSWSFARGAGVARNDFRVLLDGPGGACFLNGLYATSGSQHIDNHINVEHAKPNTTSRLYYKGVLSGSSKAVFGGTVLVRQDAQKADAQQTDKNLLLSEGAEVNSKPSLLIYADDVKCSHGATAGHIDEDTLFYMRSRGLDLHTASSLLIRGFAGEIIRTARLEPLRDYLDSLLLGSLPSCHPGSAA